MLTPHTHRRNATQLFTAMEKVKLAQHFYTKLLKDYHLQKGIVKLQGLTLSMDLEVRYGYMCKNLQKM